MSAIPSSGFIVSFTNNLFWGSSSVVIKELTTSHAYAYNNDFDTCTVGTSIIGCTNGYNAFMTI